MATATPSRTTSPEVAVISEHLRDRLRHGLEMEETIILSLTQLCLDSLPPELPRPAAERITTILNILRHDSGRHARTVGKVLASSKGGER